MNRAYRSKCTLIAFVGDCGPLMRVRNIDNTMVQKVVPMARLEGLIGASK